MNIDEISSTQNEIFSHISAIQATSENHPKEKGKLGVYAMKLVAAGAHLKYRNASTGYSFLHLSGVGRNQANSEERSP